MFTFCASDIWKKNSPSRAAAPWMYCVHISVSVSVDVSDAVTPWLFLDEAVPLLQGPGVHRSAGRGPWRAVSCYPQKKTNMQQM